MIMIMKPIECKCGYCYMILKSIMLYGDQGECLKLPKYRGSRWLKLSHNIVGIGDLKSSLNIQLAIPGSTYRWLKLSHIGYGIF